MPLHDHSLLEIGSGEELMGRKKLTQKHMGKLRHAVIEKTFGYTNECNPFNDSRLSDPFIWKEKKRLLNAMGRLPKIRSPHVFLKQTKQKIREIESVKKRREAREEEEKLLEQQQAILSRERELENYAEWEAREEAFHRVMACRRTDVRLHQGRERPCDLIIKSMLILDGEEFENLSILPCYPYDLFRTLSSNDLRVFLDDIETHYNIAKIATENIKAVELEKNWAQSLESRQDMNYFSSGARLARYLDVWESLDILGKEAAQGLAHEQTQPPSITESEYPEAAKTRDVSSGIALKVLDDLDALMKSKSLKELNDLEVHVLKKRHSISQDPSSEADLSYWDAVIERLPYYRAVATIRDMHDRAVSRVNTLLLHRREKLCAQSLLSLELKKNREGQSPIENHSPLNSPTGSANTSEHQEHIPWKPPLVTQETVRYLGLRLVSEEEFKRSKEILKQQLLSKYQKELAMKKIKQTASIPPPPLVPSQQSILANDLYESFVATEKHNMSADEFIMTPAYLVDLPSATSLEQLELKYCPRKPRFFNRVKTGYEWNKYNQTHYDRDNPPPKAVQGYKFNLFYPELIDKTKAPTWQLLPSDEPDTVLIRFHGGPPYEDVVFKILNREWDINPRTGYRNVFDRGILQVHFNFKRYRYRR